MTVCAVILMVSSVVSGELFQDGGDRLAELQNDDGGWGWPLTGTSATNTVGPIAMGLAKAYENTGDTDQLAALQKAATYLQTKALYSPSDGYLAAELDRVLGTTANVAAVKANFYDKLAAGTYVGKGGTVYSTETYIAYIQTARSGTQANMAAWDIGMGVVGATAAGADASLWIAATQSEIDELAADNYYGVLGLAGALYGLSYAGVEYDPTGGWVASAGSLTEMADILVASQADSGGFTWWVEVGDGYEAVQETAYAILALNEVDRALYQDEVLNAGAYLRSVQLATGGWENYGGSGENNEVTGEALWAESVVVPVPGAVLLGVLGLAAAGRKLRKHV
jgi:hypothetical protein